MQRWGLASLTRGEGISYPQRCVFFVQFLWHGWFDGLSCPLHLGCLTTCVPWCPLFAFGPHGASSLNHPIPRTDGNVARRYEKYKSCIVFCATCHNFMWIVLVQSLDFSPATRQSYLPLWQIFTTMDCSICIWRYFRDVYIHKTLTIICSIHK